MPSHGDSIKNKGPEYQLDIKTIFTNNNYFTTGMPTKSFLLLLLTESWSRCNHAIQPQYRADVSMVWIWTERVFKNRNHE